MERNPRGNLGEGIEETMSFEINVPPPPHQMMEEVPHRGFLAIQCDTKEQKTDD